MVLEARRASIHDGPMQKDLGKKNGHRPCSERHRIIRFLHESQDSARGGRNCQERNTLHCLHGPTRKV